MENKFQGFKKVLKTREFWITVIIMIPVVVILYGVMYFFGSPAAHMSSSVIHR